VAASGPAYAVRHDVDVATATEAERDEAVLVAMRDIVGANERHGRTF
jgi:hypothetical protein